MSLSLPNIAWELKQIKAGHSLIAGADEVGRGAWAGPVVAASVVLAPSHELKNFIKQVAIDEIIINDSKKVPSLTRRRTAFWLRQNVLAWGIGEIAVSQINRLGLTKATQMAFRQALTHTRAHLPQHRLHFLLVDAFYVPYIKTLNRHKQQAIIKGDAKVLSIAAASILAKDYRDSLMRRLSRQFPIYGWGRNKGYGTVFHQQAILRHGTTRHHRRNFVFTWLKKNINH